MTRSLVSRSRLVAGIGAGLTAAVTASLFAEITAVRGGHPVTDTYVFIASAVGGAALGESAAAVPAGIAALIAASILWAFGYLYAAQKQSQLLTRPLLSGIGFGIIVWFVMQAVLVGAGRFSAPNIYTFDRDMVGFIAFFGVPLAFVASRLMRAR